MPRLPSAQDYPGSAPSPTRGMTQVGAVRETADLATGRVISGIGEMMALEAEKLDETVALDALNQLQNKQLDLTYGENGFTKLQGKGVIDGKITSEYPAQLKAEAERLRTTIKSTGGQSKFDQRASAVVRSFTQGTYQHAAKETETFQQQAIAGAVSAGMKFAQEGDFAGGIAHAQPAVEAEILRQGFTPDAADKYRRDALGPIYASGIKTLLVAGQSAQAKELLTSTKAMLPPDQVAQLDKLVSEQTSYDKAGSLVDQARAKGLTEVQAMDFFRAQAKGDKDTAETAKSMFSQYEAADKRAEAQSLAPLQLSFLEGGGNFAAQASIIKLPEYINAPEKVRVQIRDYMTSHARAMQSFGRSEESYWEVKKANDPSVMLAFQNIAGSPETLVQYDDAQLQVAMLPVLGKARTAELIKYKHMVDGEAKKFKIPKDLIDQALPLPLQKPTTAAQKAQKQRFEGVVTEGLMDWKLANPGKQPTQEDQAKIIEGASRTITTPGRFFGTNEAAAYEFKPVPSEFEQAVQTKMLSTKNRRATAAEIQNLWALQKDAKIK